MTFEAWNALAGTIQSFATVAAIVVGAVWTWRLFIKKRQHYPRAAVSHQTHAFSLPDGRTLLRVTAKVANIGEMLMCPRDIRTRVQHLLPVPDHIAAQMQLSTDPPNDDAEFPWPVLGKRVWRIDEGMADIEPGEAEVLPSDFIIPPGVTHVLVYTHVPNPAKPEIGIGWSDTVIVSLQGDLHGQRSERAAAQSGDGHAPVALPARPASQPNAPSTLPAGYTATSSHAEGASLLH